MKKILKGFTLIEILIVVAIFSVVMTFIYSIMASGRSSWYTADTAIYVQQQARQALDVMAKELRQSSTSVISGVPADDVNYTSITFRIPEDTDSDGDVLNSTYDVEWSNPISYSRNANSQIYRNATDAQPSILANNINSLLFRRQSATPNIVEIYIQGNKTSALNRNVSFSLNSQVKVRNQ